MTFDEKITEIMRNIGIAENTLMSVQLKLDAYEARATTAEAENAKIREALRTIALGISIELDAEDGPVETWLDAEELSAIARAALEPDNG
jgi:hypothetical protein